MRIANVAGRAALIRGDEALDVAEASAGSFGPDPQSLYDDWSAFRTWAEGATGTFRAFDPRSLEAPVPRPRQVFAIGLNYREHADEAGSVHAPGPTVFTKFPSCLVGPYATVELVPEMLADWEVELVVVIGLGGYRIPRDEAWRHVAGLTIGQDLSDRRLQMRKPAPPQFSLGKSWPGFGPTGPHVVTVNELADPDDLAIECRLGDEPVQRARTSEMIFSVPELVCSLSQTITLYSGDLIFTGTPAGVGAFRTPPRWLRDGDVLTSMIDGVGTIVTTIISEGTDHHEPAPPLADASRER